MASHPEVMVLRRFRHLNVQNLLYLQAELTREERILRELEERDAGSGIPERETYSRDWGRLSGSDTTQEGDSLQWRKFLQVRELLKEYSKLSILVNDEGPVHIVRFVVTANGTTCRNTGRIWRLLRSITRMDGTPTIRKRLCTAG